MAKPTTKKNENDMLNEPVSPQQHARALVALCAVIFCFGYLVTSVFPYSGFMAIDLVETANEENAGYYAGLLSSAFMAGRAMTSYHWGKAADVYGRKTIIYASLTLSLVFSILFGLSTNFPMALLWRFLLGLSNGLMGTAKTVVAEIAGGDKDLETRGMGVLVGMWGVGLMISPAISGAIVLVTQQYPGWFSGLEDTSVYHFLDKFPFFLANAFGAMFCLLSIFLVAASIHETLPTPARHAKHIPKDIADTVHHLIVPLKKAMSTIVEADERNSSSIDGNEGQGLITSQTPGSYGATPSQDNSSPSHLRSVSSDSIELPSSTLKVFAENDLEGAIRSSVMSNYDEQSAFLSTGNVLSNQRRGSLAEKMARHSSVTAEERRRSSRRSTISGRNSSVVPKEATIASLLAQTNTRNHMIVYWVGSFVQVAVDEGLPLFLLARQGGLALSAKAIGTILSASGGVFVALQYVTYAKMVDVFGLYGSMKLGSVSIGPLISLFPVALLLNDKGQILQSLHVDEYGDLTWPAMIYLTLLLALFRTLFMAFFSSLLVALNRTVIPEHRGTMNGLATLGGSVTKAMGPSFAGMLVGFSLSSGWFQPASMGAIFMFFVLAVFGGLTTVAVWTLLKDEEEEEEEEEEQETAAKEESDTV